MIYCPNCGKGIPDQSKFCTFCGAAIKTVDKPIDTNIKDNIDRSKANEEAARNRTNETNRDQQQRNLDNDRNTQSSYLDPDGIDRTKAHTDPERNRTNDYEGDQPQRILDDNRNRNVDRNTHNTYIDQDGNEHERTNPVSHDNITPTPSHQDLTGTAHRNSDIRNEDVNRATRQPLVTDAHSSHPNDTTSHSKDTTSHSIDTTSHLKDNTTHKKNITGHPVNEFYKNIGFWGAVLVLIGFFVPYIISDVSLFSVVTDVAPIDPVKFIFLLFPVSALILIIQAFTGIFSKTLVTIFKILPIILVIVTFIVFSKSDLMVGATDGNILSFFRYLGVGFYLTVIGSILMLFFNQHRNRS